MKYYKNPTDSSIFAYEDSVPTSAIKTGLVSITQSEIMATLAQKDLVDTAAAALLVPSSVTAFQAKGALLQDGSLAAVEAIMAAPTTPALLKLAWREALYFERDSPGILWLAAQLSWTSARLDALFITAFWIKA